MTTIEDILNAANNLAADGKKPSVALIKGKLGTDAPLPLIISALKSWSYQPELAENSTQTGSTKANLSRKSPESEPIDSNASITNAELQQALEPIVKELTEIKKLLAQLVDKA